MREKTNKLIENSIEKVKKTIRLVNSSLMNLPEYEIDREYSDRELEPYDALSDRFTRAIETAIKFFKSYERYMFANSSDSFRDLLNRMEKLGLITSTDLWFDMRNIRNRIVHDYLPEQLKEIYELMKTKYYPELDRLKTEIEKLKIK